MTKEFDSTVIDAISDLLENLGHDLEDIATIEIKSTGRINVIGKDRSLRSHKIVWPTSFDKKATEEAEAE